MKIKKVWNGSLQRWIFIGFKRVPDGKKAKQCERCAFFRKRQPQTAPCWLARCMEFTNTGARSFHYVKVKK